MKGNWFISPISLRVLVPVLRNSSPRPRPLAVYLAYVWHFALHFDLVLLLVTDGGFTSEVLRCLSSCYSCFQSRWISRSPELRWPILLCLPIAVGVNRVLQLDFCAPSHYQDWVDGRCSVPRRAVVMWGNFGDFPAGIVKCYCRRLWLSLPQAGLWGSLRFLDQRWV